MKMVVQTMNTDQVQLSKRSVAKVMGVHRGFDHQKPYLQQNDVEFGGTAFFVDPEIFGDRFPRKYLNKRFALTNFHVVDELYKRECYLCYPEKGKSKITAKVIFVYLNLTWLCLWWTHKGSIHCGLTANTSKISSLRFPICLLTTGL